ncbi:probable RNA methyltransferase CG1239 [Wyeomyia smithii]|uniref:probable RNA methyltransferase CG1239 n=1 Tax=Wyeomyia smithii TaxID=174621 RepID=UPI002467B2E7|nr:probable RNA methyltransferase CG1239 [Wyeomyia smithii]XP_055543695.1 probable RNA methyltransferase CG1239 [Wyeomyia smithii]
MENKQIKTKLQNRPGGVNKDASTVLLDGFIRKKSCKHQEVNVRKKVFLYGNYDRYYGYRNILKTPEEDVRLIAFVAHKQLITGKHILDIGCNNGSLTILIAQNCKPASVVGIDIDGALIGNARRQLAENLKSCMVKGIDPTPLTSVEFRKANYVYQNQELLNSEKPQFDVILCLSVTKWIHLNFGDSGLKLAFKRVYRQLREGGIFILEAQPWSSYKQKKKLTTTIFSNFQNILLRPESFNSYLTSSEVGFIDFFELKVAEHSIKGFRRPIYVFRK